jgi:dTMP kinase
VEGFLITLEGIDGTGKSTLARILSERLDRVKLTAEPTSGEVGMMIRKRLSMPAEEIERSKLLEELFLFMADHADHLARTVIPALKSGDTVISDRYSDSTVAYQGATLRGIVPSPTGWIRSILRPWDIAPHMTILLTLDPALAVMRASSRSKNLAKFEREGFLREVAGNFETISRLEPERFCALDANKDPQALADASLAAIHKLFEKR